MQTRRKQILLVEDEPMLADITSFRLELLGYDVIAKDSAEAAAAHLAHSPVDLIAIGSISDLDPVEMLNRLSDDERTSSTPVLFLSANSDLDEVQRAYNAGADEYLLTPFDPLMLERKVERLIAASEAQQSH